MNDTVLVRGDGVAAACCVRSLSGHGLPVSVVRAGRPKLSAVLLGEATQSLLTDLFAALFRIEIISLPERLRSLGKRDHSRRDQRSSPLQGQARAKN